MPFSRVQLQELDAAVKANNLEKIDALIKPHWKLGDYNNCDAKYKFNDIESSFLTACEFELKNVIAKYLELRRFNKLTLSYALEGASRKGSLDTVKLLIEKGGVSPNEPFDMSLIISNSAPNYERLKCKQYPLSTAISNQRREIIEYLVSLKNLDINKVFDTNEAKNLTYLLQAGSSHQVDTCRLLLEHGANPLIQMTIGDLAYSFHTKLDVNAEHLPDEVDTAMAEMYLEWLSKNKHREHELNVEAARIAGKHYSESHSSGSNSPMSLGSANNSPDGSPPRHSALLQKTPPDSPVASRNGSPPGSPMLKSDSSSSGSTGRSPDKTKTARDHELLRMLNMQQDINSLTSLYDTGSITFNCGCSRCARNEENVLHYVLCFKSEKILNFAKYMLDHPKYAVDINVKNRDQRTFLHLVANRNFDAKNEPLNELKNLYLNYSDKYFIDINAKDKDGNTPLHLAGANGNAELVAELLKHKADCSIKNNEGLEPYEYAAKECKDSQKKSAVLDAMPRGSIVVSTPLATRSASANAPIAINNAREALPTVTKSYIASGAGMFSGRQDSYSTPADAQRTQPTQVGAMYVPPPLSGAQLPRPIKKPGQIIAPPEIMTQATTHTDKKSNSSIVSNKIKSLLGK